MDLLASMPHTDPSRDLRRIRIDTHWRARKLGNVHPATTLAAKFSLQHILATTAHHGHAGAPAFHAGTLSDPAIAALREKVTIGPFEPELDPPNDRPARVTWELGDGSRAARECLSARGGPDRPFTEAEIRAKIRGIVEEPCPGLSRGDDGDHGPCARRAGTTVARDPGGSPADARIAGAESRPVIAGMAAHHGSLPVMTTSLESTRAPRGGTHPRTGRGTGRGTG